MTETVPGAVSALRGCADQLAEAARGLATADPGATAFGAAAPGRLGALGRDLHLLWQRALDARGREAGSHAARLHELAGLAARAAGGLHEANERARQPEVP